MPLKRVTLENANVSDRTRKARQLLVLGKASKISKKAKKQSITNFRDLNLNRSARDALPSTKRHFM